ncbi:MAG: helix-turn-helix domain-containing protein [Burkholderia sp.]
MAIARAKGKLRGKQPKLAVKQQKELRRMHDGGNHAISDLAELFSVSRPTMYRTLARVSQAGHSAALMRHRPLTLRHARSRLTVTDFPVPLLPRLPVGLTRLGLGDDTVELLLNFEWVVNCQICT